MTAPGAESILAGAMTRREKGKEGGRQGPGPATPRKRGKARGRGPVRAASPRGAGEERPRLFGLGTVNLVLLAAALAVIVAGYVLLERGSITAAPILLVLGYLILIPAGLLLGSRGGGRS